MRSHSDAENGGAQDLCGLAVKHLSESAETNRPGWPLEIQIVGETNSLVTCAAKKYAVPTSDPKPVAPHKIFPRAYAAKVQRPDFDRSVAATFDKPVEATPAA